MHFMNDFQGVFGFAGHVVAAINEGCIAYITNWKEIYVFHASLDTFKFHPRRNALGHYFANCSSSIDEPRATKLVHASKSQQLQADSKLGSSAVP